MDYIMPPYGYVDISAVHHDPDVSKEDSEKIISKMKAWYVQCIREWFKEDDSQLDCISELFFKIYNDTKEIQYKDIPQFFRKINFYQYTFEIFIYAIQTLFNASAAEGIYEYLCMDFEKMPLYINNDNNALLKSIAHVRLKLGR